MSNTYTDDERWIDDIETQALAQAASHARMVEIGEGIGGLGVRNRAMFEDMIAWQDATSNGHADTVLRLVDALRAADTRGEPTEAMVDAALEAAENAGTLTPIRERLRAALRAAAEVRGER